MSALLWLDSITFIRYLRTDKSRGKCVKFHAQFKMIKNVMKKTIQTEHFMDKYFFICRLILQRFQCYPQFLI
jgi:hypothetical protein